MMCEGFDSILKVIEEWRYKFLNYRGFIICANTIYLSSTEEVFGFGIYIPRNADIQPQSLTLFEKSNNWWYVDVFKAFTYVRHHGIHGRHLNRA